jgi:hypothetical protein
MQELQWSTDSDVMISDPVNLVGLWVHDPDNAEQTSTNFLYGKDARSVSIELNNERLVFAGREFGITEFGEHRDDTFAVSVTIPHGPSYNEDRETLRYLVLGRKTMCYRDNRGVVMFGTVGTLGEDQESHGSVFSFEVNRVHREVFEVS